MKETKSRKKNSIIFTKKKKKKADLFPPFKGYDALFSPDCSERHCRSISPGSRVWTVGFFQRGRLGETVVPFKAGIDAALKEINDAGGISGNTLRLYSLDDQYLAAKIPGNVATLLNVSNLIAFVGFTGSAPVMAAIPLINAAKMPFIGPFTGTPSIRKTPTPLVINIRAGYDDEAMAMLVLLIQLKRLKRIAICYQNDAFGQPSKDAVIAAMATMKMRLVGIHPYEKAATQTMDYSSYALNVSSNLPQGIIFYATEAFTTPFLNAFLPLTSGNVTFVTSSFMGDGLRLYLKATSKDPSNYYQTQIMPHPLASSNISKRYRAAMVAAFGASVTFNYVSMEGYVLGRFLAEALWRTRTLTKEGFLDAVYKMRMVDMDELLFGPISNTCTDNSTESSPVPVQPRTPLRVHHANFNYVRIRDRCRRLHFSDHGSATPRATS